MGRPRLHAPRETIIEAALTALEIECPMSLRQLYYRLVSGRVLKPENFKKGAVYKDLSAVLRDARLDGSIPWEYMEDRTRRPRPIAMWNRPAEFAAQAPNWYRRNVWATQPGYLEVWLEKDALAAIFEEALEPYGVTLHVGRGYDGWDSIHDAAEHLSGRPGSVLLYYGDFDPSGRDIYNSLISRLAQLGCSAEVILCALTEDQVKRYDLPPIPTKIGDTRSGAYVAEHGDEAWELDALPGPILRKQIAEDVSSRMDLDALKRVEKPQERDRARLTKALEGVADA